MCQCRRGGAHAPGQSKLHGEPVEKNKSGVQEGAARPLRPCQVEGVLVGISSWGRECGCCLLKRVRE